MFLLFKVERRLKELDDAGNTDELVKCFKNYGEDLMKLAKLSGIRQAVSDSSSMFMHYLAFYKFSRLIIVQWCLAKSTRYL